MSARLGATLLWLSLALALGACAPMTHREPPSEQAWLARRAELTQLDHFLLQARIASGRVGWSGHLHWRQTEEYFDIRISGPLGAGAVQARGHLGEVTIRTPKETLVTQDPDAVLQETLGWSLPLQHLRYWAIGVPFPDTPAIVRFDAQGRLLAMEQDGWRLEYSEYGLYQHYELPRRFSIEDDENRFRVVVDGWSEIG